MTGSAAGKYLAQGERNFALLNFLNQLSLTIYSWNSTEDLLIRNLLLKISTPKRLKIFLTKHFIENC